MSAGHTTAARKHPAVVARNKIKRLDGTVNYLISEGNCVTLQDISSLLNKSPGTKAGKPSDNGLVCPLRSLFQEDALTVLMDLIHQTYDAEGMMCLTTMLSSHSSSRDLLKGATVLPYKTTRRKPIWSSIRPLHITINGVRRYLRQTRSNPMTSQETVMFFYQQSRMAIPKGRPENSIFFSSWKCPPALSSKK